MTRLRAYLPGPRRCGRGCEEGEEEEEEEEEEKGDV